MKDVVATILIDIKDKTQEEVFRNVEYSRRKNIKRAMISGLSFEEKNSEEELKKGYAIYSKVVIEGGTIPDSWGHWKKLISLGKNKFYFIKYKDEVIGCFAIREITKRFYNLSSDDKGIRPVAFANLKKFNEYRPNDFMYWNTILYGIKNKVDFVDLGGWQINPRGHLVGVNKFKEQWGGEKFYYYNDYPFFKAIGRKLIRNNSLFWWVNKKIRQWGLRKSKDNIRD